jgi:hypothetical protein
MKRASQLILFVTSILFFTACGEKDCRYPTPTLKNALEENERHWLESMTTYYYSRSAKSNFGRTSPFYVYNSKGFETYKSAHCREYQNEIRKAEYENYQYYLRFNLNIGKNQGEDLFVINEFYGASFSGANYAKIKLANKSNLKAELHSTVSGYNMDTIVPYQILPSFSANGKDYSDVYKVDFVSEKYSIDKKLKTFWVDQRFGVLQFETFDGEIWTF